MCDYITGEKKQERGEGEKGEREENWKSSKTNPSLAL